MKNKKKSFSCRSFTKLPKINIDKNLTQVPTHFNTKITHIMNGAICFDNNHLPLLKHHSIIFPICQENFTRPNRVEIR